MAQNPEVDGFHVDPDSPITAWGQVYADLQRRLTHGEFVPGEKLPSETALASQYGVSRVTMRRALQALVKSGKLYPRRGSGTYVSKQPGGARYDVQLMRPWREQLLASGHVARPRLVEFRKHQKLPPSLAALAAHDRRTLLSFGVHVQEVNGTAIAVNESWFPNSGGESVLERTPGAIVSASCTVEVSFASEYLADLLDVPTGTPLLEVIASSRLRETGELVELARTSWVPSRIRLSFTRTLTAGQIDMSELLWQQRESE